MFSFASGYFRYLDCSIAAAARGLARTVKLTVNIPKVPQQNLDQSYLDKVEARLARLETRDLDLKGRRVKNSADALDLQDLVTLQQLQTLLTDSSPASGSSSFTPQYSFAYNSASQTVATGSTVVLTYNTNIADLGGLHSGTINPTKFTISITGLYLVFCQLVYPLSALGTYRNLSDNSNGAGVLPYGNSVRPPSAAVSPTLSIVKVGYYYSGDYITFVTSHDAGVNQSVLAGYSFAGVLRIA